MRENRTVKWVCFFEPIGSRENRPAFLFTSLSLAVSTPSPGKARFLVRNENQETAAAIGITVFRPGRGLA
jgi:hypothetical protein